jgi:glyoxylase-like metal-dependent hydrolase (beta-lactamase superfamily II)
VALLIDYKNGLYALDAGYVRPLLAAIHLVVDAGRVAVIDTGSNAALPSVLRALAELALGVDAVDYVILTHIHLDHAGGAGAMMGAFRNAKLVVHPRGVRHMVNPARLMAATEEVYGRELARSLYGELVPVAAERVVATTDGLTLSIGGRRLVCYDAPGHAKHHVVIHDPQAAAVFTGDTFGLSYREMDVDGQAFVFPTTTPSQFEPDELRRSVERILALQPEAVYLTHFSRIAPPEPLAADLLRRLERLVAITRSAAAGAREAIEPRIATEIADFLLTEARQHGVRLMDEEILALWRNDIDLNAQGLALWAKSAPA